MHRSRRRYLDKTVSVLGSEVHGEVQATLRVARVEVATHRVHEDASALAPHLAALANVQESTEEHRQRLLRAVHSTGDAARTHALVRQLDNRRPQSSRRRMMRERLHVQRVGRLDVAVAELSMSPLPHRYALLDPLQHQLPLVGEAEQILLDDAARHFRSPDEVENAHQLETHCVRAAVGSRLGAAHETLRGNVLADLP